MFFFFFKCCIYLFSHVEQTNKHTHSHKPENQADAGVIKIIVLLLSAKSEEQWLWLCDICVYHRPHTCPLQYLNAELPFERTCPLAWSSTSFSVGTRCQLCAGDSGIDNREVQVVCVKNLGNAYTSEKWKSQDKRRLWHLSQITSLGFW